MSAAWTPEAGEIIWVQFDPQVGREPAGHRPAVVISPGFYNRAAQLLVCVPMTTRIKGYRFEVPISGSPASVALVDHVRSIDWQRRGATRKGQVTPDEFEAIRIRLRALLG